MIRGVRWWSVVEWRSVLAGPLCWAGGLVNAFLGGAAVLVLRILVLALVLLAPASVRGHVNDRGMDYGSFKDSTGIPCCNDKDCHPAEKFLETVENGREVIRLLIDGLWITVPRAFVIEQHATDGRAHWCGIKLKANDGNPWRPGTRCVILPPRYI
jgi:hypothetical protein